MKVFIIVVIVAAVTVLAIQIGRSVARFRRKLRTITDAAQMATRDELEAIYLTIENISIEPPVCAVLAKTNDEEQGVDFKIPVPDFVEPWGGGSIEYVPGKRITFRVSSTPEDRTVLNGKVFRAVRAPRQLTKKGRGRNMLSPNVYYAKCPAAAEIVKKLCPEYPKELLCYLFSSGMETFQYDSINQARIGSNPEWIQAAEFASCPKCKKRMALILQIPGALLPAKLSEGNFYFFGCKRHPEETATVDQYF